MIWSSVPSQSVETIIQLPGTNSLIHSQVSLADLTSYRVGGAAQWYSAPRNWEELQATFEWFQNKDVPLTLLGAGSNLLISDRGIPGLTLSTRHLRRVHFTTKLLPLQPVLENRSPALLGRLLNEAGEA